MTLSCKGSFFLSKWSTSLTFLVCKKGTVVNHLKSEGANATRAPLVPTYMSYNARVKSDNSIASKVHFLQQTSKDSLKVGQATNNPLPS